jgi:hypothetical protein
MGARNDIPLRIARDRVIDLLGIGDTYPLTDLDVVADGIKVNHGEKATIPIEYAQAGVTYQLCDPKNNDAPIRDAFKEGNDVRVEIETPSVKEDVSYRILATKRAGQKDAQAPRFLDEDAPVKVGLETSLEIRLLPDTLPLVDPSLDKPQPSDPRIVPYGDSVQVAIAKTQEGVMYSLVLDGKDLDGVPVPGTLHEVRLDTGPLHEDTVIQVRAAKYFPESLQRKAEVSLLDGKLTLKVKANPAVAVSVDPPVTGYGQDATIRITGTQKSARYLAWSCPVADADYVRGAAGLQVRKPALAGADAPAGYKPVGEALTALQEDTHILVQAIKEHSTVWLGQGALALVRPDPDRKLTLRLALAGAQTGDSMQVSGGEPGVFYFFSSAGKELERAAYFHKRIENDTLNKGIGQFAVGIDFAIAADPQDAAADRAATPPRLPQIDIAPLAAGSSLTVRAVKAQTGVDVPMTREAQIPAPPAIRADPAIVDYGAVAKIAADGDAKGYEFTLDGAPVKLPAQSEPLTADAVFELVVTQPAAKSMPVEGVLRLAVRVRPNAALAVTAKPDTVSKGGAAEIVVGASQPGVNYRLMAGSAPVGEALAGTGADLALPSGPIAADTTFSVTATRADNAQLAAVLQQQVTVKLAPA